MKIRILLLLAFGFVFSFHSCREKDPVTPEAKGVNYIINYGSYSGDKGSISVFDTEKDTVSNKYYESVNGVAMTSNSQYAYQVNDEVYFMGNSVDQIFWVDAETFEQTSNGVTSSDLVKPRYCVADANTLYVSCWGGEIWKDESISYIAKFNLTTKKVEGKIALPGGPEGLAIVNGKLYAALNYKDSVAVINLSNDAVSYITTPAVTSYFIKDDNNNLYVSLISTYSDNSTETGLGYIDTSVDKLDKVYKKEGVSSAYVNILSFNKSKSKLYVMASSFDANWKLIGSVEVFDVATKSFSSSSVVSGISGLNGIAVDPESDNLICFVAESTTASGMMKTYSSTGTVVKEYKTGISPFMLLNVK